MSELIFIPKNSGLSKYQKGRLRKLGYEIFEVNDPGDISIGLPMGPIIQSGDVVAECLIQACEKSQVSSSEFGRLLLEKLTPTDTEET